MKKFKGQITIEFLLATLFVIITLSTLLYFAVDYVPEIEDVSRPAEVTMEARRISSMLMTSPGRHSFGTGGPEWQKNSSTLENIDAVGLAQDYHVLEREKVENLSSFSSAGLNYTVFRDLTDIESQYRMVFTYMPVIHTPESYIRTSPPEFPNITEPSSSQYTLSGNRVNYGNLTIGGIQYNFLVTSHGGVYDTVYRNRQSNSKWNFTNSPTFQEGDEIQLDGRGFTLESIQNTRDDSGSLVVLSRQFKEFGPSFDTTASIEKINRYAVLNESGTGVQPVRMEVFAWRG